MATDSTPLAISEHLNAALRVVAEPDRSVVVHAVASGLRIALGHDTAVCGVGRLLLAAAHVGAGPAAVLGGGGARRAARRLVGIGLRIDQQHSTTLQ